MAQTGPNLTAESDSTLLRHKPKSTRSQGITSHRAGIAWSWFLITVPISALTAVFLALVFHYRLQHGDPPFPNLRLPSAEDEKNVFYVNLSSNVILFSTSWASSVAPMLSSFVLVLASFPIARRLSRDIQRGRADRLPTPYQLSLTLKFIDGSPLGAMWGWICYVLSWNKGGERQTPPLRAASTVAVLATLLGYVHLCRFYSRFSDDSGQTACHCCRHLAPFYNDHRALHSSIPTRQPYGLQLWPIAPVSQRQQLCGSAAGRPDGPRL
jgi:hypothetical protein